MVLIFPFETCLLFGCSFPLRFLRWGLLSLLFVSLPCFVCHFLYACSALLHLLVAFLVVFLRLIGFSSALFPWYFSFSESILFSHLWANLYNTASSTYPGYKRIHVSSLRRVRNMDRSTGSRAAKFVKEEQTIRKIRRIKKYHASIKKTTKTRCG